MVTNNTIQNPVGLDAAIHKVQSSVASSIAERWPSATVESFGRVYKNRNTDNQVVPEWFNGSTGEYQNVYYNDTNDLQFMFLTPDTDTSTDGLVFNSVVKVVFLANLAALYPNRTSRSDAEFQRDVISILRADSVGRFEVRNIERTIPVIFRDYTLDQINFTDIDPRHSFAVNINLAYYLTDKCE